MLERMRNGDALPKIFKNPARSDHEAIYHFLWGSPKSVEVLDKVQEIVFLQEQLPDLDDPVGHRDIVL